MGTAQHVEEGARDTVRDDRDQGGPVLPALYLGATALLWLVSGLGALVGIQQPLGPAGPVSFSSEGSLASVFALGIVLIVLALIVAAWRGRWWGYVLLGGVHLAMAGFSFSEQLLASAVTFGVIGLLAFFVLGLSKA